LTSNGRRAAFASFFSRPAVVAAAAAFAVRIAVGWQGVTQNPLLTRPQLDSDYYVRWAREIANGDLASSRGIVAGAPFVLNPLYAYVLAPIVGAFADASIPMAVMVFQALLGAATAALAAVAARRFFGRAAAWTAGVVVAFSTPLVQLDAHVAVSGLAAFLTAGAVFASAPPREGSAGRGHGPFSKGLWLGVGALARPITQFALPLFAWEELRRATTGRIARVLVVVGAFAACAAPSLARNWSVAGEPLVYTGASGLNLHLGNNVEARKYRTMVSQWVRFNPETMHDDARRYVYEKTGRNPTPSETSSYFAHMTVEEFVRCPAESAAYYANKARWFFAPAEVPSSASLANDLRFVPLLHLAFMPTWLVASAALVGAALHRRRRDVLCGPGALALAHFAVLTLVFPLSHYRSPAIPALAVLAGGAVQAAVVAWGEGARRRVVAIGAGVFVVAAVGACPPQPSPGRESDQMLLSLDASARRAWDEALVHVNLAITAYHEEFPDEGDFPSGLYLRAEISILHGDELLKRGADDAAMAAFHSAVNDLTGVIAKERRRWPAYVRRSKSNQSLSDYSAALIDARLVVKEWPIFWEGHGRLCEVLTAMGQWDEAIKEYEKTMDLGGVVDEHAVEALRQRGLPSRR
jgi:4-amino-4-deoxy-L-arabinose transferase-like glycosyltransferase